jgi:glycosyltransferase involved in cell wall biosynthesis
MTQDSQTRPRVGLIVGALAGTGGMELSALRHARLLADDLEVITISLEESRQEGDWYGRVQQTEIAGQVAYRIFASDFSVDRVLSTTDISKLAFADQLVAIARKERLAALHVYGAFEMRPFIASVAAVRSGLPLIVSFRGADLDLRIFGSHLAHLQAAVRVAGACVCVNKSAQNVLRRLFDPRGPVLVIHNHVDPSTFDDDAPPPTTIQPRGAIIGCVGEFRRIMGLDFLLRAFDELAAQRELSLLLAGPLRPTEAMYYSALLDGLEHSSRVRRVGSVPHSQVLSYMKACDLLVFPSITDGCPNKVLEAMLAGCAIVASDVGGIPELIRDGVDGLLVPPRDQQRLMSAISALLDDPRRRRELGASARARVLAEFTPAHERAAWLRCYREVGLC